MTGSSTRGRNLALTSVRRLIDDVPELVRQHGRRLLPGLYVPVLIAGLLGIFLQQDQMRWALDESDSEGPLMAITWVPAVVASLTVYLCAFYAALVATTEAVMGRTPSMARAWLFVARPAGLLAIVTISILGLFSLILCLLPALYVLPRFAFVLPAMFDEKLSPLAASRRSRELIYFTPGGLFKSGWALTLVVQTVGALVAYAVTFIVQMPFSIVQMFLLLRDMPAGGTLSTEAMIAPLWLQIPMVLLSSLGTSLAWLYWCFATAALFRELRRRKEGDDLQEAIDALTGMDDTSHEHHEETPLT